MKYRDNWGPSFKTPRDDDDHDWSKAPLVEAWLRKASYIMCGFAACVLLLILILYLTGVIP